MPINEGVSDFLENIKRMSRNMLFPVAVLITASEAEMEKTITTLKSLKFETLEKPEINTVISELIKNKDLALKYNKELFTNDFIYKLYDATEYRNLPESWEKIKESKATLLIIIPEDEFSNSPLNKLSPLIYDLTRNK
jgi:hypothetical protein